ncbi:RNA-binding protein 34 isoform 1 [Mus musculus]|uniref:RNA-binding protein 34 n=1 Tax=Mus musculus TaxID=10090 RepID=RBM34_MOUSE|nr:RNA-binding protein 34 isoform 1 [Mus musculus]Q8C5L7.2 RecName: Full=RNA-binding protein 34; AltName: Full=RNA-binding motif protein 34 [Mus musculus]AAI41279.1 RNA binding motif protein 34 [Mus musculus]EDL11822.1 RNA binding motif protein 34, isoform CRA_a [Mus musculus]|eukprot:NP_766350.2 RNA-binding protein 34 [Mus musculus]
MALGGEERKRRKGSERRQSSGDGVSCAASDYLVGQVADSLRGGPRPPGGGTGRLAALFSTAEPSAPPVFVPVPQETSKKRKLDDDDDDEEESVSQTKKPVLQEPSRKVKVKKLSDADKRLANRESALASADLEEELHQDQGQGRRRRSQSRGKVADGEALDVALSLAKDGGQRTKIPVNPEEERLKNERTVFVGNLPVTCNKKKLKSFFKEYGQVESVRFRSVMPAEGTLTKKLAAIKRKFHPDQKSINAYVVFKDESAAAKALQRNGAQIAEGFRIRVDLASETASRDKRSVFVGNLPYKIEDSALEEHFLDCGSIVAVRIVRNPLTGVGRGFGYVLFENTDAVHLALKLNNSELMGRKLRVMRSVNKEKLKQQNSNPSLKKDVIKPKQRLNFTSKEGKFHSKEGKFHSKNAFIGEKAVLMKKKKKGQKKKVQMKKPRKQQ